MGKGQGYPEEVSIRDGWLTVDAQRTLLNDPIESTNQPEAGEKKLRPELAGFIDRVLVPILVARYIKQLKEGKQPSTEFGDAASEPNKR